MRVITDIIVLLDKLTFYSDYFGVHLGPKSQQDRIKFRTKFRPHLDDRNQDIWLTAQPEGKVAFKDFLKK